MFRIFLALMCLLPSLAAAGSFAERLAAIEALPDDERSAAVDDLLADLPGGAVPVTEDSVAHFLWRGQAERVRLAGDMTGWQPELELRRLDGTPLWHLAWPCPPDTRVDYKLVLGENDWRLDPLNPAQVTGGFGPNSELAMPGWPGAPELLVAGLPPASIHRYDELAGDGLGDPREIWIVLPPGYDPAQPRRALLVHDGLEFMRLGALARVLAWLAAHEPDLELPLCVCVPPGQRSEEYAGPQRAAFLAFLVETVMPFVEARYAVTPGRAWGSLGASNGGNISLELAAYAPERVGAVIAMSPYVSPEAGRDFLALGANAPELYLNWGRYDIPRLLPLIEGFVAELNAAAIPHRAELYNDGHSWGLWRSTLDAGLRSIYARPSR